jgi:hypothetical protein
MNKKTKHVAFVVVGYSNWGKSTTLGCLVPDKIRGWVEVCGNKFFLRRMSNSDYPQVFGIFLRRMSNSDDPFGYESAVTRFGDRDLILTFNPGHSPKTGEPSVDSLLSMLTKTHACYFFVLKKSFSGKHRAKEIATEHIKKLENCGTVVCTDSVDKQKRADEFKKFICEIISKGVS